MEAFVRDCGVQQMSNIFQYYTLEQRLMKVGENGVSRYDFEAPKKQMIPAGFNPKEDYWRNFNLTIIPGSLHSGSKDREKSMAIAMARTGEISKRELYRRLELPENKAQQILKEMVEEAQMGFGAPHGRTPRTSTSQKKGAAA